MNTMDSIYILQLHLGGLESDPFFRRPLDRHCGWLSLRSRSSPPDFATLVPFLHRVPDRTHTRAATTRGVLSVLPSVCRMSSHHMPILLKQSPLSGTTTTSFTSGLQLRALLRDYNYKLYFSLSTTSSTLGLQL